MIIDTSAVIAILRDEPESAQFSHAIAADPQPKMSVVSYVEAGVVADRARNPAISRYFDDVIRVAGIEIETVTREQGRLAREAYRDFGRGSGHVARLNFGDCFAYALAKEAGEPLLFKGADFSATDITAAV
jgi:ribonuclease VapC